MIDVVIGLIKKNGQYLITERPIGKSYASYWEFPGGKIEKQENALAALKRELAEELGIEVLQATFLFKYAYDYPQHKVNLEIWTIHNYKGTPFGKENQKLEWRSAQDLNDIKLLEGNRVLINYLNV